MLAGTYFYHGIIRRYAIAFGTIFSNLYVQRADPYGVVETQSIKVPLIQASKRKFYEQLKQYAEKQNDPFSILLPRMSFILTNLSPDPSRKKNLKNAYRVADPTVTDPDKMIRFFEPSPWNFSYSLAMWAVNESDCQQLIEQICPFFDPTYMISVNEMPTLGIKRVTPVDLTSGPNYNLQLESGEDTRDRIVQWDLSFTLKGYLYKQNVESSIIKKTIMKIRDIDDLDSADPYTWWEEEQEVIPWEAEEGDDWHITRTNIQEGKTTVVTEDKPE
jgi:hypothetical protein